MQHTRCCYLGGAPDPRSVRKRYVSEQFDYVMTKLIWYSLPTILYPVETPWIHSEGSEGGLYYVHHLIACFTRRHSYGKSLARKSQTTRSRGISMSRFYGAAAPFSTFRSFTRLSVERRTSLPGGNTRRRFHGTIRACQLGDRSDAKWFCTDISCSLCNIIRVRLFLHCINSISLNQADVSPQTSFEKTKAGQRTNFGRFGEGIYTSATSSKVCRS